MGYEKERNSEIEQRGFSEDIRHVCCNCVGDEFLSKYIENNGKPNVCDFCTQKSSCVTEEDLMYEIMDGIKFEYIKAIEELGQEGGEYMGLLKIGQKIRNGQ